VNCERNGANDSVGIVAQNLAKTCHFVPLRFEQNKSRKSLIGISLPANKHVKEHVAQKPNCATSAGLPFPPPGNRTRPCGFEDRRAPDTLTGRSEYSALARSRTWSTTFGGSRAIPSHSKGYKRRSAGVQGFEPCRRALEARCSPRSTPLSKDEGGRMKDERESDHSSFRLFLGAGSCHGQRRLMGHESRPALDPGTLRGVERLPLGANRPAA
jgi:hypothetical protein